MERKPYGTRLSLEVIQKIREIAEGKRWNHNDVIEVAVEELYFKEIIAPTQTTVSNTVTEKK